MLAFRGMLNRAASACFAVSIATATGHLQVSARGWACAEWDGGPNGMPADCVYHTPPSDTVLRQGAVCLVELDPLTGVCSDIAGVTEAFGNMTAVHGNFVAPDPAKPNDLVGYGDPYFSYNRLAVHLPADAKTPGSVEILERLTSGMPPAWIEPGLPDKGVLAWSFIEAMSTGGGGVNLTETLASLDPATGAEKTLWTKCKCR